MKKNVLVLGSRSNQAREEESLESYRRYFAESISNQAEVFFSMLDDLIFDICPDRFSIFDARNNKELSSYSLIILRGKLREDIDLVIGVSNYAKLNNVKHFNDYEKSRSISKLVQAVTFYKLKIPFPRTIYCSKNHLKTLISEGSLEFPFIYKSKYGAHGINNFLVKSLDQLEEIDSKGMIAQEFIPNDYDYRILIIGDHQLVIKRRSADGGHLNNTSQGGSAELVENFNGSIISQSRMLTKESSMQTAGVDVIVDKNDKHYFLEINSQPQLQTGAFVNEKQKLVGLLVSFLLK